MTLASPTASVPAGLYTSGQTVALSGSGTIVYTLDGTLPRVEPGSDPVVGPTVTNGTVYTGPISVPRSAMLQAISYSGSEVSPVASWYYDIEHARLFGAPFRGFERGMTVTIRRPIEEVETIGGPVLLIPHGTSHLDEWRVETEFWVPEAWASDIEAMVPPYGDASESLIRLPPRLGGCSFPGLLPASTDSTGDVYLYPEVTRLECQGRKGPRLDMIGYYIDFALRERLDSAVKNPAKTAPTTSVPACLAGKFVAHQRQAWSNQTPAIVAGGTSARSDFRPARHGSRVDYGVNLDHLDDLEASSLVALFRGARHNPVTVTVDRGPAGYGAVSVRLTGLSLHRSGLCWDGSLEMTAA